MRLLPVLTVAMLLLAGAATPAAATSAESNAYAGANIEFSMESNAIVDYTVDGAAMLDRVEVQSKEKASSGGVLSGGASLSSVTSVEGSGMEMQSKASASAQVKITSESGATVKAHDNEHGIFLVDADEQSQIVTANVSDGSSAEQSDDRVVVTNENGAKGTFLVVGDGEVTVNENGDVTAELEKGSKLVYRSYPSGERDDDDKQQEQWIQDGKAAAELYVFEKGGEMVTDTVQYSEETTVTVSEKTTGKVVFTAERSSEEGKVIITSVSEKLISSADSIEVNVDGSAAAEASSYSELEGALGSDSSKFLVSSTSEAQASTDVLVAVNHFSEREVTMTGTEGEGASGDGSDDGSGDNSSSTSAPGFGVGVTLVALLGAAAVVLRRN